MAMRDQLLSERFPRNAARGTCNRGSRNAYCRAQVTVGQPCGTKATGFSHDFGGEPSSRVILTSRHALSLSASPMRVSSRRFPVLRTSSLSRCVSLVLGVRTKPEVGRVATSRYVAGMADVKSGWNIAVRKHPCYAVDFAALAIDADMHIPVIFRTGRPNPALVRLVRGEFSPEHLDKIRGKIEAHRNHLSCVSPPDRYYGRGGIFLPPYSRAMTESPALEARYAC
jgi:hypothetical protein